jgi:O-antigen/teichoic acid export membrane protein
MRPPMPRLALPPMSRYTVGSVTHMGRRALATGTVWSIADQSVSSLTNLVGGVAIARVGGPSTYGGFAVATAIYLSALGFQRTLISTPLVVTSAAETPSGASRSVSCARTATILYGIGVASLVAAVGAVTTGLPRTACLAIAPWLPFLILQDFCRSVLFLRRRARAAVVNDAVWGVGLLAATPLLEVRYLSGLTAFWAVGGALGAVVGIAQTRCQSVGVRESVTWWLHCARRCGIWFGLDHAAYSLMAQGNIFIVASVGGAEAAGGIRAITVLLAPIGVLGAGGAATALPILAQIAATNPARSRRIASAASTLLVTAGLIWAVILLGPGRDVLPRVFGSAFEQARPALVPIVLSYLVTASTIGIDLYLSATTRARDRLRARIVAGTFSLPLMGVLTAYFGLSGAGWGMATSAAIGALCAFRAARSRIGTS